MSDSPATTVLAQAHRQPLVTVGLPTYNRPAGLRNALEWIGRQTWQNLEIIVSDNCSTNEEVTQITTEFANRDSRIRVYRQPENIGLENNFNFVYAKSTAPYFIWMSDDDLFEANYIEECVRFLELHPDHVLCSGVAKYYKGEEYIFSEPMFRVDQSSITGRIYRYFGGVQKNGNFYGVFRNKLLSGIPIRPHVGCDWSFMGKLAIAGKLSYIDTTAYHRSIEGHSQSRKKMVQKFGLKGLKNIFFETYLAYTVAANIFTDEVINRKLPWWKRRVLSIMVFIQVNWKLLVKFLRKVAGVEDRRKEESI